MALGAFFLTGLGSAAQAAEDKTVYVGEMSEMTASYEDTMVHIARAHNLGFIDVKAANPDLDAWIPGAGAKITLPTMHLLPDVPHKDIVINLAEMRLYFFPRNGEKPLIYPIGIGREGLGTPTGLTTIIRKAEGPTWRPTPRMREEDPKLPAVVPPGPENPMGTHAMYLGWPQYAIHGTNKPYGIGRRVSSGCIRLYPEGITDLFPRVPNGAQVNVVNQPLKAAWIGDKLYVESHPNVDDTLILEQKGYLPPATVSESDLAYVRKAAGVEFEKNLDLNKIKKVIEERRGYPVAVYTKGDVLNASASSSETAIEPAAAGSDATVTIARDTLVMPQKNKDDHDAATVVPDQKTNILLIEKTAVVEDEEPYYRPD
jgi:L,D-transpeptidase ErfK/SrfK